jgi:hypothetical protein
VLDAKRGGGGAMVRAQVVTSVGNAPIFVNPTRIAGAWPTMTGDMDTVYPRSGDLTFYGFGLDFF